MFLPCLVANRQTHATVEAMKIARESEMLAKPKFFDSPSRARVAALHALHEVQVACSVNDVLSRADRDEGKWFAIIVLDTDSVSTLLHARKRLPDFRVIGEVFPEKNEKSQVSEGSRRLGKLRSPERIRHLSS